MREKFCMRCGTPLNGAVQCPECGYAPQHGEPEKPGGPAPAGQSAPQAENRLECGPRRLRRRLPHSLRRRRHSSQRRGPPRPVPPCRRLAPRQLRARLLQAKGLPLAPRPARRRPGAARSPGPHTAGRVCLTRRLPRRAASPRTGCRRMPHPAPAGHRGAMRRPMPHGSPGQSPLRWAAPSARCWRALCRSSGGSSCSSGRLNRVQSQTAARWRAGAW